MDVKRLWSEYGLILIGVLGLMLVLEFLFSIKKIGGELERLNKTVAGNGLWMMKSEKEGIGMNGR
jgi:hypothetical protein